MNYRVIWLDEVDAAVLRLYLLARSDGLANPFTEATARIEQLLATDPLELGESRSGHKRIVCESPLTVDFEVHEEERTVIVTRAAYSPPR